MTFQQAITEIEKLRNEARHNDRDGSERVELAYSTVLRLLSDVVIPKAADR